MDNLNYQQKLLSFPLYQNGITTENSVKKILYPDRDVDDFQNCDFLVQKCMSGKIFIKIRAVVFI